MASRLAGNDLAHVTTGPIWLQGSARKHSQDIPLVPANFPRHAIHTAYERDSLGGNAHEDTRPPLTGGAILPSPTVGMEQQTGECPHGQKTE